MDWDDSDYYEEQDSAEQDSAEQEVSSSQARKGREKGERKEKGKGKGNKKGKEKGNRKQKEKGKGKGKGRGKGRGPAKAIQSRVPMFLEYDDFDLPTGEWEQQYGQQIGQCALRIDINIHEWEKVDQIDKDNMWEETKRMFHIDVDPQGKRKKNFLTAVGSRFRRHKSWLVSRFVDRSTAPPEGSPNANLKPWELYEGYITEDQWKIFEAYVKTDEFKEKSAKGKKIAEGNIHRHTMGQKSYSRKRKDWIEEKRLPPPTESTSRESSIVVNEKVVNRALEWCLSHQKPTPDGKWEADPNKPETVRVVNLVLENLEKEAKEREEGRTPISERGIDALTKALGKKDHRGYVKGLGRSGVGVGLEKAFGKADRRGRSGCSKEELEAVKATLTQEFEVAKSTLEQRFEERLQECVAVEVKAYLASLSPLNMPNNMLQLTASERVPLVNEVMPLLNKKVKLSSQNKERVASSDPRLEGSSCARFEELVGDDVVAQLTEECELLFYRMYGGEEDTISIPLKAPLFYLKEDKEFCITSNDVSAFLKGARANVSLIHVYILYLVQDYISLYNISQIAFLCPQRISAAEIKRDIVEAQLYMKRAFLSKVEKNDAHVKFILAPYIQDDHWILIVIDLRAGIAFKFDPAIQHTDEKAHPLLCEPVMHYAYKIFRSCLKGSALKNSKQKLVFKQIECAQQIDGTECGYYVMRYMYEIVALHSECKGNLLEEYIGRSSAYNEHEINQVREQWAKFLRETVLLKGA